MHALWIGVGLLICMAASELISHGDTSNASNEESTVGSSDAEVCGAGVVGRMFFRDDILEGGLKALEGETTSLLKGDSFLRFESGCATSSS